MPSKKSAKELRLIFFLKKICLNPIIFLPLRMLFVRCNTMQSKENRTVAKSLPNKKHVFLTI